MFKLRMANKGTGLFFIFLLLALLWPLVSGASSGFISETDLDDSDPVEFSSSIMEIDYGKGVLMVAENEVVIVDLVIGDEQFTTLVADPDGQAISLESFHKGQIVLVQGLKLADGRVVASRVQKLAAPVLTIRRVRKITPVE